MTFDCKAIIFENYIFACRVNENRENTFDEIVLHTLAG